MRAWAERATGDDRANLELYRQVVEPVRLPFGALLLVAFMIIGFSRVLLTLPDKHTSTAVFGLLGVVILGGCVAIALKPKISRSAIALVLFVARPGRPHRRHHRCRPWPAPLRGPRPHHLAAAPRGLGKVTVLLPSPEPRPRPAAPSRHEVRS